MEIKEKQDETSTIEKNEHNSNLKENVHKIEEEVSSITEKFKKEANTPEGKKNLQIIVVLGLILSIMAVVYISLSKNLVNHTPAETKVKAMEYSQIAKDKAKFIMDKKAAEEASKESSSK